MVSRHRAYRDTAKVSITPYIVRLDASWQRVGYESVAQNNPHVPKINFMYSRFRGPSPISPSLASDIAPWCCHFANRPCSLRLRLSRCRLPRRGVGTQPRHHLLSRSLGRLGDQNTSNPYCWRRMLHSSWPSPAVRPSRNSASAHSKIFADTSTQRQVQHMVTGEVAERE